MSTEQKQAIELFKETLNPSSKFYAEDLQHFINGISLASKDHVRQTVNNLSYARSKKADNDFNRETKRMEIAGMFNIGNMHPRNSLD